MTANDLHSVFRAKVFGGCNLHARPFDDELDFFPGYSSIASVWGSQGQGHYAAIVRRQCNNGTGIPPGSICSRGVSGSYI